GTSRWATGSSRIWLCRTLAYFREPPRIALGLPTVGVTKFCSHELMRGSVCWELAFSECFSQWAWLSPLTGCCDAFQDVSGCPASLRGLFVPRSFSRAVRAPS